MKTLFKSIIYISSGLLSLNAIANYSSVEISGDYINNDGWKAIVSNCTYYFHPESQTQEKNCRLTVILEDGNGNRISERLTKTGKIDSVSGKTVTASDTGIRYSGVSPIPYYVDTRAEITINKSFKYPFSYPEDSISKFDIVIENNMIGGRRIECKNLELVDEI